MARLRAKVAPPHGRITKSRPAGPFARFIGGSSTLGRVTLVSLARLAK
jgi:hypothetical protein